MKISFNWLKELVALPSGAGPEDVARRLTLAGLEVESIERRGRDVTGVRVAEVRGIRPHPGAEKLRIVKLTLGDGDDEREVVCGAPNVPAPGGLVAWAPPGATLPGGLRLGRKEIRGFDSPGMICSERELGLGEEVDGILILSTSLARGADVAEVLGLADDVFEVNVTPNRADALSHAGIAREVAALYGVSWRLRSVDEAAGAIAAAVVGANDLGAAAGGANAPGARVGTDHREISVEIRDPVACPRYHATAIRGVRVGPSPLAIRLRLATCGVRAISNLVDVTNYVMLETGHPLHAFDLDRLGPEIVVRRAAAGETIQTLDGTERQLEGGDILICGGRTPGALAGIMGGATSEVSAATTNVLLEAATFDSRSVRRSARRLGLHSEASHRFERGVDAAGVPVAGARAAAMLARLGGGSVAGEAVDRYPAPVEPRHVALSTSHLARVAGFQIPAAVAVEKLRSVEIPVLARGDDLVATIPSFRPDLDIAEDLVEEVMRLVGYDQAPARLPAGGRAPAPSAERPFDRARDLLAALGLHEIAGWAFIPRAALGALGDAGLASAIAVKNPISADYEVMRTSLLPGLVQAARRNLDHGISDVRLFEVGPVIRPVSGELHHEQLTYASGLLLGRGAGWLKPGEPVDFFDLKHVVVELLRGLAVADPIFSPISSPILSPALAASTAGAAGALAGAAALLHPGIGAEIHTQARDASRKPLGFAGELHPIVARRLGLEVPAFVFELHLDGLQEAVRPIRAVAPPRFPSAARDISFWIAANVDADAQRSAMQAAGESLLQNVAVLEDFRDGRFVPPGQKGMLWTLTYRAEDRTLTDAEVDAAHARVLGALGRSFVIQVR